MLTTEYVENFVDFYATAGRFFEDHYKGCEEYRAGNKQLNIDVKMFQQMIDLGTANFFILKEEDNVVGYVNVSINPSPLFKEPQALIDFLYIVPEYRRQNYAAKAISEIEKELEREGLKDISLMLPNKDYSDSVGESLGYVKTSTVHTKCLGDN